MLEAFPSVILSDTWWGSFTDGELAYWVTTHARREISSELLEPYLAICPFILRNASSLPLPVHRFAVRVAHLTLYGRGDAVWSDEVRVRYEGPTEGSELQYTGRVPAEAGVVDRLAGPREAPASGLHAITFGRLRSLSGIS